MWKSEGQRPMTRRYATRPPPASAAGTAAAQTQAAPSLYWVVPVEAAALPTFARWRSATIPVRGTALPLTHVCSSRLAAAAAPAPMCAPAVTAETRARRAVTARTAALTRRARAVAPEARTLGVRLGCPTEMPVPRGKVAAARLDSVMGAPVGAASMAGVVVPVVKETRIVPI